MTNGPTLSVVIVNWNVCGLLRECLRSVRDETRLNDVEVFVIDNASSDDSVEMVRAEFPQVRLVVNHDNEGFARANNRAFRLCRGRYVLLLNPDTVVTDRALDRLVAWMTAHPRAGVAGCRLLNSDGSLQRWTGGAFPNLGNLASHHLFVDRLLPSSLRPRPIYRVRDETADERVDWVSGACLVVRREALMGTLFDESYFMYAEDMELCERIGAHGWEVWYTPSATIMHHHRRSIVQQSGHVALSPVQGPRAFFAKRRGRVSVVLYDLVTITGFCLRWLAFGALSRVSPGVRYRARALVNRQLTIGAIQVASGR